MSNFMNVALEEYFLSPGEIQSDLTAVVNSEHLRIVCTDSHAEYIYKDPIMYMKSIERFFGLKYIGVYRKWKYDIYPVIGIRRNPKTGHRYLSSFRYRSTTPKSNISYSDIVDLNPGHNPVIHLSRLKLETEVK